MVTKLLLGYDGSASAERALGFALEAAQRYGAQLHVLAVARPPDLGTEIEVEPVIERELKHYESVLAGIGERIRDTKVDARSEVAVGHPAEQLLRYAEQHGIDHIVVGNRGRSLFERLLLGSIARQVVAHAKCNVTVVKA
ncbi:MAG: universal stress protein [Burkholderiales bacterium]|nr:universal stress protein [Burkholderiales bacterium]